MPKLDKTGPQGQGPMTGRGMGSCCSGNARRGFVKFCGCGCGMGAGRFAGRAYLTKEEELKDMTEEATNLKADLQALEEQIAELKK